jgi:hypothetical protein
MHIQSSADRAPTPRPLPLHTQPRLRLARTARGPRVHDVGLSTEQIRRIVIEQIG